MPADEVSHDSSTVWVPLCCERVMRHNVFRNGDQVIAAALVCTACGKNVALTPRAEEGLDEFGAGAQVIAVLAVAKPVHHAKVDSPASSDMETLG